jgi:hypothetical protein
MMKSTNQITLVLTVGLLISASEIVAHNPLQTRYEQLLRSMLLQGTDPDLQETALAQNVPLELVPWPSSLAGPYCSAGRFTMLEGDEGCTAFMISKNYAFDCKTLCTNKIYRKSWRTYA